MVCVSMQTGEYRVFDMGSGSMDGSCLGSQDRGWVRTNCVGILEVCVWRGDVSTACAEVWDIVALR